MSLKKFIDTLTDFLDNELGDYNATYDYEEVCYDLIEVKITMMDNSCYIQFKYEDNKLYLELYDSNWEEVNAHSYKVKYFWMLVSVIFKS